MTHSKNTSSFFSLPVLASCFLGSLKNLSPRYQMRNPVMFATYMAAIAATAYAWHYHQSGPISTLDVQIPLWLWFTVLFANFAESIAESRGKAHAASLRNVQTSTQARKIDGGFEQRVPANSLKKGDHIVCEAGDIISADGEVIEGIATVDESAITGESAPVIRESGGDRNAVTAGTQVVSDRIIVEISHAPGESFLDHMIHLIEGAKRQKTPNEIALHIVLCSLTLLFLLVMLSLKAFMNYSEPFNGNALASTTVSVLMFLALFVCLIPTTISGLLSAIGIAGIDRLARKNVIAKSGQAVEAAGDVDLLILDKTGTITLGNRMATHFFPVVHVNERTLATVAQLASMTDETPEGRSIVVLAKQKFGLRGESLDLKHTTYIPFSARTRMSGIDTYEEGKKGLRQIRKGSPDSIRKHIEAHGGIYPAELEEKLTEISKSGGTPLLVSDNNKIVGIIQLKDIIKGGLKERFAMMRKMGIRTVMVTGDNPLTAAAIAAEAGVDDYIAEATPEQKLHLIRQEQAHGKLIAMTGDGTNDAPALAQADVAVAMHTGTEASREAGNMIDLDSNPTKLLEIIEVGKQLLMTRGALTTFSVSNDIAKCFAILPAMLQGFYLLPNLQVGPASLLNVMHLSTPHSALLSALIFNALIIPLLVPLALHGVAYKPESAHKLLRRNVLIYGLGGALAPFIGIKTIDLLIQWSGWLTP